MYCITPCWTDRLLATHYVHTRFIPIQQVTIICHHTPSQVLNTGLLLVTSHTLNKYSIFCIRLYG